MDFIRRESIRKIVAVPTLALGAIGLSAKIMDSTESPENPIWDESIFSGCLQDAEARVTEEYGAPVGETLGAFRAQVHVEASVCYDAAINAK